MLPGEKIDSSRSKRTFLDISSTYRIGDRVPHPCVNKKMGYYPGVINDGFLRIPNVSMMLQNQSFFCPRGILTEQEQQIQKQYFNILKAENEYIAKARMRPQSGDKAPHFAIEITHKKQCEDKGLTHKLNNFEMEIQLAWLLNRSLEGTPELIEPTKHTGCSKDYRTPWSYIVDVSGDNLPLRSRPGFSDLRNEVQNNLVEGRPDRRTGRGSLWFDWTPDSINALRRNYSKKTRLILDPPDAGGTFPWCTHYMRGITWDSFFLPWSKEVLQAAHAISDILRQHSRGGHCRHEGVGCFDAIHFRAGDKAHVGDPFVGLRAIDSDDFFCRIYAHLGNGRSGHGGHRPLYVATDSPNVLRFGRGAIAVRHFWPHFFSTGDFTEIMAMYSRRPGNFAVNCTGVGSFFVLATELALLEKAHRFVATERSNPSRRVVLVRNKRRKATEVEPIRYLYSSLVLHFSSQNVSISEWERASIRSDEESVASLNESATAASRHRYILAKELIRDTPCLRAHGVQLGPSMNQAISPGKEGKQDEEGYLITPTSCCEACKQIQTDGGNCSAWQWEHPPQNLGSLNDTALATSEVKSNLVGICRLRSGPIHIVPVKRDLSGSQGELYPHEKSERVDAIEAHFDRHHPGGHLDGGYSYPTTDRRVLLSSSWHYVSGLN